MKFSSTRNPKRWRFEPLLAGGAVLQLILAIGVPGRAAQNQKPDPPAGAAAAPAGNAENGKKLFLRDGCYECHGIEGQGANGLGPRLAPDPMPLRGLTNFLRKPTGSMPPYTTSIVSDQEAADIHAYLRSRPRAVAVSNIPTFERNTSLGAGSSQFERMNGWARLPSNIAFAAVAAVAVGPDGSVYALQRADPPILKFDRSGTFQSSWGSGLLASEHGLSIDAQGNVWVTAYQIKDGKGSQVFKFSPDGKLLLTLGKAGVAGKAPGEFDQPTAVAVAPNGDIFVAEGHNNIPKQIVEGNHRIQKFSKDGTFVKMWGRQGSGPGEFSDPHSMAFDAQGRLVVADRGNNRLQLFDQDGRFLEQWTQFGKASGVYIVGDRIYVADAGPAAGAGGPAPGWKKGIRIGSVKEKKVLDFIEDIDPGNPNWSTDPKGNGPEGCAADAAGNVYASYVTQRTLVRFAKR